MKSPTIDDFTALLYEAMQNINKDSVSKDDLAKAKAIEGLGKTAIEGFKTKVQALGILSKADNPKAIQETIQSAGVVSKTYAIDNK